MNTRNARRLTFKRTLSLSSLLVEISSEPASSSRSFVFLGLAPGSVRLATCNALIKNAFFVY